MPDKRYIITLSNVDRMVVRQDRAGPTVLAFSVQLEVLVSGRWYRTVRFDSSHGQPHLHTFYPDGTEYKEFMVSPDNNRAFTEAQVRVRVIFRTVNEHYKLLMERMIE